MNLLKNVNLLVRFLLELCMLAALAYWGWRTGTAGLAKIGLSILLPLIAAIGWGLVMAPKASHRLTGWKYAALEVVFFGAAAAALWSQNLVKLACLFVILVIANRILIIIWHQHLDPGSLN